MISQRCTGVQHARTVSRFSLAVLAVLATVLGACTEADTIVDPESCPDPTDPPPCEVVPEVRVAVRGTVTALGGGPIEGAVVTVAGRQVTVGADGQYAVGNLPKALTGIRAAARGFGPFETTLNLTADTTTQDIALTEQEVFTLQAGNHILYIPRGITTVRGVLVAFGGPDTRSLADPTRPIEVGPTLPPELAASLGDLRLRYSQLATVRGLAVMGVRPGAGFDLFLPALAEAVDLTARPELAAAPLLFHGMSAGTFPATILAAQNAARTLGVVLRVPGPGIAPIVNAESGTVPTLLINAALDEVVTNTASQATYSTVRAGGGLWAYANEPGVGHYQLTVETRNLTLAWFEAVLDQRLPTAPGGPIRAIAEEAGWLGSLQTLAISPWEPFGGDRRAASWFPSEAVATLWQAVVQ